MIEWLKNNIINLKVYFNIFKNEMVLDFVYILCVSLLFWWILINNRVKIENYSE